MAEIASRNRGGRPYYRVTRLPKKTHPRSLIDYGVGMAIPEWSHMSRAETVLALMLLGWAMLRSFLWVAQMAGRLVS